MLLAGCTPAAPSRAPLSEGPALEAIGPAVEGPAGADARPRRRVAFVGPAGARTPIDREAIAFVPRWREGAALVDPRRRLYEVLPTGARRMLARGAVGPLAVSQDAERLAFVTERGALAELHLHDGARDRRLLEGFASIGVLRFEGASIVFVGARPGGIAGLWVTSPDGAARCLTNCELRTGEPFLDRFVPPPVRAEAISVEGDDLRWTTPEGVIHEVSLR